jgi:AcrR family transcriptional regulator
VADDAQRIWGGRTLEDRRATRREQLLEAGYELLGTRGASAVTVRAVCRGARLSERYFYESFSDRDELLVAVHGRTAEQARAAIAAAVAVAPTDPEARATVAVEAFADLLQEDPRRGRVLLVEALGDETLTRHGLALLPAFSTLVVEQIHASYGPGGPDAADAQLTSVALVGALTHLFLGWLDGRLAISRERLVTHAVRLIVSAAPVSSRPS